MKYFIYILALMLFVSCSNSERRGERATDDEYTCPMHPEIVKSEPGQCPICGMDLVRRSKKETARVYTCPMHPEIIRDQPGACPICGMDLVEKQPEGTVFQDTAIQFLLKPTNQFVVSKIKTVSLFRKEMPIQTKASGIITYDTRFLNSVSSRVTGRIEKLYVKYRFQPVKKGDKLMEIYSEELVAEQQNYLYLLTHDASNTAIVFSAETKLELLGLTKEQIQNLKDSRKVHYSVTVNSPYSGHLHEDESFATQNEMAGATKPQKPIAIREGMYVQKGQTVFNIYSTDNLWAVIDIPAEIQSEAVKDQPIKIYVDGLDDSVQAKIDFIEPTIRSGQSFSTARIELNNPASNLKIGAIVRANIQSSNKKGYFLPSSAVVNLGRSSVVFIMREKLFEAHEVICGLKTDGWVQVISGLNENDIVAENAQLLIDSESFVRTAKQ